MTFRPVCALQCAQGTGKNAPDEIALIVIMNGAYIILFHGRGNSDSWAFMTSDTLYVVLSEPLFEQ